MFKRNLEKEVEIMSDEMLISSKFPIKLEYYLLESQISGFDELDGINVYGIEIIKKVKDKNDEIAAFKNIYSSKESTRILLNKLSSNTVTPIGLPYVLDDIIGL